MNQIKVVTPTNLGATIVKDALVENKWDVKIDPSYFEVGSTGIKLKDAVLEPLKNAGIQSGTLNGSTLELSKVDGSKIQVSLADLVPAAKADKFLKSVTYDSANKKLVFSVGNDLDASTESVEVSVADLLPVVVGNGLEGDGTAANPLKVKLPTGANHVLKATDEGIVFDTDKLVELTDGTGDVSLGYIIPKASA